MNIFIRRFRQIIVGMLLTMGLQGMAQAGCRWVEPGGAHNSSYTVMPPGTITLRRAALGQSMGFVNVTPNLSQGDKYFICNDLVVTRYMLDTSNLVPSGYRNVWKTAIPGVGITVEVSQGGSAPKYLPVDVVFNENQEFQTFQNVYIRFIRIDTGVVGGEHEVSFKATFSSPGLPNIDLNIGPARVNIVNDVYFSSCAAVDKAVTVQMGQEPIERIQRGEATEHPFGFDVSCLGLKPNAAGASVRTYFEGNAVSDGLLRLSSTGASAATGIGIGLVSDSGAKLPFAKARALPLNWARSTPEGEIYRFSGKAKYAPTSGPIKPGEADAVMNFVIEYN